MSHSYRFRKIDPPRESRTHNPGSEPELPWIERARRIERGLHAARDLEARPEFVGHEVCELHADAMHIFHRASERERASDDLIDRGCDRRTSGRSVLTHGSKDLEGDELRLRPDAKTDRPDAVSSQDRQAGATVRQDLRPRQRDVDVVENEFLQAHVRARHAGRDFVMGVDDVVPSPPVLLGFAVREGLCGGRPKMTASDPPGGGDDVPRSRKPKIEARRPAFGSPRQGRPGEGLFEIHYRRSETIVIDSDEARKSPRKITNRERMDLLPLRDREHAEGRRGHDAERPLRSDEQPLQVEAGRGSHRGTGAHDGPVREDHLEPEDLVPHRPAEVSRVPDPVGPDCPSEGRARARPRIVAEGETLLSQSAIQRLQDYAGLRGCPVRGSVDRQGSWHSTHDEDGRIRPRRTDAQRAATAPLGHGPHARGRGEADDDGDIFRRAGPDHRGRIDAILREAGPAMGSERIEPVSGWDRRTRCDLVSAEALRELRESRAHADGNAEALFNPRGHHERTGSLDAYAWRLYVAHRCARVRVGIQEPTRFNSPPS